MGSLYPPLGGEHELRRDRRFSQLPTLYRVYLDNFDELRKTDRRLHELIGGHTSESVARLREAYAEAGPPNSPEEDSAASLKCGGPGCLDQWGARYHECEAFKD